MTYHYFIAVVDCFGNNSKEVQVQIQNRMQLQKSNNFPTSLYVLLPTGYINLFKLICHLIN